MIGILNQREMFDPNICKVVVDKKGYALYFTRASVPYNRNSSIVEIYLLIRMLVEKFRS